MSEAPFRFATFDIETTQLEASYGRLLCACFKFFDEDKVRTIRAPRYKDEPKALAAVATLWNEADVIIHWNGKLFDVPFINARLMIRRKELPKGVDPILDPTKKVIDGRWISSKLRTRGNSLDGMAKDMQATHQKYDVAAENWIRAADGDKESFERIVKHCEEDVKITQEVITILKPYIVRIQR